MNGISVTSLVKRGWMVLVAVAVVAVAGVCVYRLHGIFGSHNNTSAVSGVSNDPTPFNPKHVTLEVFGHALRESSPWERELLGLYASPQTVGCISSRPRQWLRC